MGQRLQAIIGAPTQLEVLPSRFRNAVLLSLPQNLAMVPFVGELFDEIPGRSQLSVLPGASEFFLLSRKTEDLCRYCSHEGPIAYIETEFFGGKGRQSAVAWARNRVAFGPESVSLEDRAGSADWQSAPINRALRLFGVRCEKDEDEYDALGLGAIRDIEDWFEDLQTEEDDRSE